MHDLIRRIAKGKRSCIHRNLLVTEQGNEMLNWLERGCKCSSPCDKNPPKTGMCVYFIAKTRGPIQLVPCHCANGGKTFHSSAGKCLRCEFHARK